MMMRHRITMMHKGKEYDMTQALPKIEKDLRRTREDSENRYAASVDVVDEAPELARWYCLTVHKDWDFAVEKSLSKSKIVNFMARENRVVVRRGVGISHELPFFPGYILVLVVPSERAFLGLKSHEGVSGIVGDSAGTYYEIPDREVDVFKKVCAPIEIRRIAADKTMREGDRADIVLGPFAGFMCVVTAVKWCRQARASVRIDISGRAFDIDSMPVAFLRKL